MTRVDMARCRLWLTDAELSVAVAAGGERFDPDSEASREWVASLAQAGAVVDGRVPGWVDEMLSTVARPALRIIVQTLAAGPPVEQSIWATPQHAVTGARTGDDETELALLEPVTIPWAVTQMVGLGRRPPPAGIPPIRISAATLETCEARVDLEQTAGLHEELKAQGLGERQAKTLVGLLLRRRLSWRAFSVWTDPDGHRRTEGLSVIDGGDAGLWLADVDRNTADDPMVTIRPTSARAIWDRIVRLLPHRQDSTQSVSPSK